VRETQGNDLLLHLFWGGHGVALVYRREVFEPLYAVRLEAPLVLIELGAGDPTSPASLGDVSESLSQFQYRKSPSSQFVFRFHALLFLLHGAKDSTAQVVKEEA